MNWLVNIAYGACGWSDVTCADGTASTVASTTGKGLEWAVDIAGTIFTGFFDVIITILPYAIGILIFYIGYRLARRALSGR